VEIRPLGTADIGSVMALMRLGEPFLRVREESDYWLDAHLFAGTCPVAVHDDQLVGVAIAFRSQSAPQDVYVQDVMTHPHRRRHGIARRLIDDVRRQATAWGCTRLYLTSEPGNQAAHDTWLALGFTNVPGDFQTGDMQVTADYKGPGRHRAVYQITLG
jgi:GNAT superfamily N-acetyltransferase